MAGALTYDPNQVSMIVGGKIISGFMDGTFISAKRNAQTFNLKVGASGEGTRIKSNNKSGVIEITLQQSSPSNDDLAAFAAADELANGGVVPLLLKDNSGRTVISAVTAWVQKQPDSAFALDLSARTWILETDSLEMFVAGN